MTFLHIVGVVWPVLDKHCSQKKLFSFPSNFTRYKNRAILPGISVFWWKKCLFKFNICSILVFDKSICFANGSQLHKARVHSYFYQIHYYCSFFIAFVCNVKSFVTAFLFFSFFFLSRQCVWTDCYKFYLGIIYGIYFIGHTKNVS